MNLLVPPATSQALRGRDLVTSSAQTDSVPAVRLDLVEDGLVHGHFHGHWVVHRNMDVPRYGVWDVSLNSVGNLLHHGIRHHLLDRNGDLLDHRHGYGLTHGHVDRVGLGHRHKDGVGDGDLHRLVHWHMDLLVDVHGNMFGHRHVLADLFGVSLCVDLLSVAILLVVSIVAAERSTRGVSITVISISTTGGGVRGTMRLSTERLEGVSLGVSTGEGSSRELSLVSSSERLTMSAINLSTESPLVSSV